MKFKYKPKSTKYQRDATEGTKSASSLEYKKVTEINPKINRNFENKENVRENKDLSNLSTNIGNISKISSVSIPNTGSKLIQKRNLGNKSTVSHIKNISMDNANALDHNILE